MLAPEPASYTEALRPATALPQNVPPRAGAEYTQALSAAVPCTPGAAHALSLGCGGGPAACLAAALLVGLGPRASPLLYIRCQELRNAEAMGGVISGCDGMVWTTVAGMGCKWPKLGHQLRRPAIDATVPRIRPRGNHMAAYFIVHSTISDETQYQKYRDAVIPLMARFGAKIIVRGSKVEALEGRYDGRRMVIFEF